MLGADLVDGPLDVAQVRDAIDYAVAAIEIVDSRIADWDITFADTVADNASSGALRPRAPSAARSTSSSPSTSTMTMTIDGEEVSTGNGAACLGDPLKARRLAGPHGPRASASRCAPARSSSPARSARWHRSQPGHVVTAEITGLGTVTATFQQRQEDQR